MPETQEEFNFLQYLKKNYKYLFDLEMEVRRVIKETGYGDCSSTVIIKHSRVFTSDVMGCLKHLYEPKKESWQN